MSWRLVLKPYLGRTTLPAEDANDPYWWADWTLDAEATEAHCHAMADEIAWRCPLKICVGSPADARLALIQTRLATEHGMRDTEYEIRLEAEGPSMPDLEGSGAR